MKKKLIDDEKNFSTGFNFWRYLINTWTVLFFSFIVYDFIFVLPGGNSLEIISAIYIGVLAIYVGNKEFERWYNRHQGRHPGEVFVIVWTALIFSLILSGLLFKEVYKIPSCVISSYIAVLTILVITNKSKQVYFAKKRHRKLHK
jgi:TRAP-type uncharacterized transport system fused permease subunit